MKVKLKVSRVERINGQNESQPFGLIVEVAESEGNEMIKNSLAEAVELKSKSKMKTASLKIKAENATFK